MKCEKCGEEIKDGKDYLIETGETLKEQTKNHIHVCESCYRANKK